MHLTRRKVLLAAAGGLAAATPSFAVGGLEGAFIVRCQNGHDNIVNGVTVQHNCETAGCGIKSVVDGGAWVVCPVNKNHRPDWCDGVTRQHQCSTCGTQCRLN
jgi:hypothetical protein